MKTPRPWYRKQTDTWYICLHGNQVPLIKGKDNKAAAEKRYFQVMAREGSKLPDAATVTVAAICDLFLDWSQRNNEPATYTWYQGFLQSFCERSGGVRATDLKPFHVTEWLDRQPGWRDGTRRCAITALKRSFNWAEAEGILNANPLKKLRKPAGTSRDRILTAVEKEQIVTAIKDQPFRDFVFALTETGCRPSEVARVTAADVNLEQGVWIFQKHKTRKKTGKPRIIYLTPGMLALTRTLIARHPTGPLFRGPRGNKPFSKNGIRCRFKRLRAKLPQLAGVIAYTFRHTFATDALENGVGVAEVAELLGHQDCGMVMKHYGHLREKREHMRQAAVKAATAKEA